MHTDTEFKLWNVDHAPHGRSLGTYTQGLEDAVGAEIVVLNAPTEGRVPGGALTELDASQVAYRLATAAARGERFGGELTMHHGLTRIVLLNPEQTIVADWNERHPSLHVCVPELTTLRHIRWKYEPGTPHDPLPGTSAEIANCVAGKMFVAPIVANDDLRFEPGGPSAWDALADHLEELAGDDLAPFARMAGLGAMQIDEATGPLAVRGDLQAAAIHIGDDDTYLAALSRSREITEWVTRILLPATSRSYQPHFDARRTGLFASISGLLLGVAFHGRVWDDTFNRSVALPLQVLTEPTSGVPGVRFAGNQRLSWERERWSEVAGLDVAARQRILAVWHGLTNFHSDHYWRLVDRLDALWTGLGHVERPLTKIQEARSVGLQHLVEPTQIAMMAWVHSAQLDEDERDLAMGPFSGSGLFDEPSGGSPRAA